MKFRYLLFVYLLIVLSITSFSFTTMSSCQEINSSYSFDTDREIRLVNNISSSGSCIILSESVSNFVFNCDGKHINTTNRIISQEFVSDIYSNINFKNCIFLNGDISLGSIIPYNIEINNITIKNSTFIDENFNVQTINIRNSNKIKIEEIKIYKPLEDVFYFDKMNNSIINEVRIIGSEFYQNFRNSGKVFSMVNIHNSNFTNIFVENLSSLSNPIYAVIEIVMIIFLVT